MSEEYLGLADVVCSLVRSIFISRLSFRVNCVGDVF
jgi:hypothetical protein